MKLEKIFERVSKWNSERYERIYNHKLTINMLEEEYEEYINSKHTIDKVDALCDIIYICLGVCWKLNHDLKYLDSSTNKQEIPNVYLIKSYIDFLKNDESSIIIFCINKIINHAILAFIELGFNQDEIFVCMLSVCDSNDTKIKEQLPDNLKMGPGSKGKDYIPPTQKLLEILKNKNQRIKR